MNNNPIDLWLNKKAVKLKPKQMELGLDRIRPIYEELIKHNLISKKIVIAGTNGKGTTAEFLSQLLMAKNRTVGTFTSCRSILFIIHNHSK